MAKEKSDAAPPDAERLKTIEEFHKVWYNVQFTANWMGYPLQKCPMDLFMYQEIVYECRPDCIIECGTWSGGSALYFAHLFDLLHHGMIVTIDINRLLSFPIHNRIAYVTGSSVDAKAVRVIEGLIKGFRNIMVILDSDHTKEHVLKELNIYSDFVTPRQYLVVEDGNIHGHPVRKDLPAGPYEAVDAWLPKNPEFIRDPACERFLLTMHPGGWLRRMR